MGPVSIVKGGGRYKVEIIDVLPRRARGERQGSAKLTAVKVVEIRRLYKRGAGIMPLARAFGVTPPTIRAVLNGKSWRHVRSAADAVAVGAE
jgi:hypothetical protein